MWSEMSPFLGSTPGQTYWKISSVVTKDPGARHMLADFFANLFNINEIDTGCDYLISPKSEGNGVSSCSRV